MKKEQKGFFEDLRDRNVWREVKAYLFGGAALIPLLIANKTKKTAQEWGIIDILP